MRKFELSVSLEVSEEPFEAAETIAMIKVPFYAMLKNLQDSGLKLEYSVDRKARVGAVVVARRGRKPRQQVMPQAQLPVADDNEPTTTEDQANG